MALIGTLRNKMGAGVVIFVFVAIAAFILSDALNTRKTGGFFNKEDVGEIAGHSVSMEEYKQMLQEQERSYALNYNREPSERDKPLLQMQAWELLVLKYAIQKQFDKTGVEVTSDEVWDMIQGKNVDPNVKQAFTNQETGAFDRDKVVSYIGQLKTMPEGSEPVVRWDLFQKGLKPGRERIKYENLLIKTNYVTTAEAEKEYHNQSDVAEARYLYVPNFSISDSSITVTDDQLQEYYNKNREKYKTEEVRDLDYVVFPITASSSDSAYVKGEITKLVDEFKKADNDSSFAALHTENSQTAWQKLTAANLPQNINKDSLSKGKVIGPFIDNGNYKLMKVSKMDRDTTYTARASHILIRWNSESEADKKEARDKAQNVLNQIKGGANFAAMAKEYGTDGTKDKGGDLDWFTSGQMVQPFEAAVFKVKKPGLINELVETQFGYHIIDVTGVKKIKTIDPVYYLAVIEHSISPSDVTTDEAYRRAENFIADLSGVDEFKNRAKKEGIALQEAKGLKSSERRIGNLDARQIVQWLFRDASKGKVSTVFDLQGDYVVAIMTGEIKKGYKPFEAVKEEITPAVRNEQKGKKIIEKLKSATGTLDEIAKAYGPDANVYSSSDIKLSSSSLPTIGIDPQAVGTVFSLENGKRSKPLITDNGVVIFELGSKTIAPEIADYTTYKTQLEQGASGRSSFNIATAIKEDSDIEDERYKIH